METVPVFKRLSTWANIFSVVAASIMASPASVAVPVWLQPWVWPICCIVVAVAQVINQNKNSQEWW